MQSWVLENVDKRRTGADVSRRLPATREAGGVIVQQPSSPSEFNWNSGSK